jgi:hypothetical protein
VTVHVNPDKAPWNQLPIIIWTPDPNYVETPMTDEDWARATQWLDSPERHAHGGNPCVRVRTLRQEPATGDACQLAGSSWPR